MRKLTLISVLLLSFPIVYPQENTLVLKKRNKSVQTFWKGAFIAFQTKDKQWQKGEIMQIQNDSFYIRPRVIRYYLMGSDTLYYPITGYALADVFSIPKKGLLIDYRNGQFEIIKSAGHMHFYWVKSGWLFRVGAAGYAALNVINGVIHDDYSVSENKTQLAIAASVFLVGVLLHKTYKPTLRLGKKYRIEIFKLK